MSATRALTSFSSSATMKASSVRVASRSPRGLCALSLGISMSVLPENSRRVAGILAAVTIALRLGLGALLDSNPALLRVGEPLMRVGRPHPFGGHGVGGRLAAALLIAAVGARDVAPGHGKDDQAKKDQG